MTVRDLKFSQSAENNKDAILKQMRDLFSGRARILEIASGTGQHAVHIASALPNLSWTPSDLSLEVMDLLPRLENANLDNIEVPIALDIAHWPNLRPKFDGVFSANCIHIAPEFLLKSYVEGCAKSLKSGGKMMLYGPFKYAGEYTTPSNAEFNMWLAEMHPGAGIRDFETVCDLAAENGLLFREDRPMPANNQFLVFEKA